VQCCVRWHNNQKNNRTFFSLANTEKAKVEAKRADKDKERRKEHFRKAGQEEAHKEKVAAKAATKAERPTKRRKMT
jgi:hypothetical protein